MAGKNNFIIITKHSAINMITIKKLNSKNLIQGVLLSATFSFASQAHETHHVHDHHHGHHHETPQPQPPQQPQQPPQPQPPQKQPPQIQSHDRRSLRPITSILSVEFMYGLENNKNGLDISKSIGIGYYSFYTPLLGYTRTPSFSYVPNSYLGWYTNFYTGLYRPDPFYSTVEESDYPDDSYISEKINYHTINAGLVYRINSFLSLYAGGGAVMVENMIKKEDPELILAPDGYYYINKYSGAHANGNFGIIMTYRRISLLVGYNTYARRVSAGYGFTF